MGGYHCGVEVMQLGKVHWLLEPDKEKWMLVKEAFKVAFPEIRVIYEEYDEITAAAMAENYGWDFIPRASIGVKFEVNMLAEQEHPIFVKPLQSAQDELVDEINNDIDSY